MTQKKDSRSLPVRLWIYQSERVPLAVIIVMSALATGVMYRFAEASLYKYLAAVVIIVLYLVQIRVSDERKDFEHDNKFYKHRPVQRGLVTLGELSSVGLFAITAQLVIYASFLNLRILILGLLSQSYAFLTRKEFYIRDWLRKRLLTYNLLHQIQLIILFFAVLSIIKPLGIGYGLLLIFIIVNIVCVELARKTLPASEDAAKDSYSARLGYKGVAITLSICAALASAISVYIISQHSNHAIFIILPVIALAPIFNYSYHFGIDPNKANEKGVQASALLVFVACMLGVIAGK